MRRSLAAILSIVAAVVVLAAAIYVIAHKDPVSDAGKTPGFSLGRSESSSPTPSTSTSTSATAATSVVAFLGDSYTASAGSTGSGTGFVALLGKDLGITAKPHGVTGGGYAKQSDGGDDYSARIDSIVAEKPDVVVITGGRNDVSDDTETLKSHADDLFKTLHEKLPDATLVAVAPFWGDSDAPSDLEPVATAVKDAVKAVGGTYLDVSDPLNGHPSYMSDNETDPNNMGYAAIAEALAPELKPLLPTS